METILEGIIISIYTSIIYIYIKDIFTLGFLKHFLAGIFGLHKIYCNYKYDNYNKGGNFDILIIQSITEGLLFVILSTLNVNVYVIPFILHITFEILGLHKKFCKFN